MVLCPGSRAATAAQVWGLFEAGRYGRAGRGFVPDGARSGADGAAPSKTSGDGLRIGFQRGGKRGVTGGLRIGSQSGEKRGRRSGAPYFEVSDSR